MLEQPGQWSAGAQPTSEVLTITECAERLGISVRTVQRRLDAGALEAVTVAGKRCVRLSSGVSSVLSSDAPHDMSPDTTRDNDAPGDSEPHLSVDDLAADVIQSDRIEASPLSLGASHDSSQPEGVTLGTPRDSPQSDSAALHRLEGFQAGLWSAQMQEILRQAMAPLLDELRALRDERAADRARMDAQAAHLEALTVEIAALRAERAPEPPQGTETQPTAPEPQEGQQRPQEPTHAFTRGQALRQLREAVLKLMGWR